MAKKQQVREPEGQNSLDEPNSNETPDQSDEAFSHPDDNKPAHSNLSKFQYTRTKAVAVPLFKLEPNVQRFFLVDSAIFTGKKIDDKKEAALLMPVTDLETGEQGQIIVGAVLKELIYEMYPDGAYVGKKFEVTLRKRADKKYNTYDLYEITTD